MMFRITSCVCKARCLLHQFKPVELAMAKISRCPPNDQIKKWQDPERVTCPKPKVLPPPPKDDRMFWGSVSTLVIAGGFAVYAKHNPEVRDWLTMHAPWFDDIIAVAYQENMSYLEFAMSCVEDAKKGLAKIVDPPKDCSNEIEIIIDILDEPRFANDEAMTEEESPCDLLPAPVITKDICKIEACMKDLGDGAIHNYMTARDACLYYNKLVDDTMRNFTISDMKKLRKEMEDRRELVIKSVQNAEDNIEQLEDLVRYLDCGGVCDQKQKVESTKEMWKEYRDQIRRIDIEYQWENDKSLALDAQWIQYCLKPSQSEKLIDIYTSENQSMYPTLDYEADKPAIQGGADFLLHHTRRYVNKLQAELIDPMTSMTSRVDRGLEMLPQCENLKKSRDQKVNTLYRTRKAELDCEFTKRLTQLRADNDKATKDALKLQQKRHEEDLANRLMEKETDAMSKFNKMVADRVAVEKKVFDTQLREMQKKLAEVEFRLNARLNGDRETKRSQDLWSAGASLLAATKKGEPYVPVTNQLKAISRASGDGDKLVLTVLNSIPQSVWDKGVVPESVLRERYHSMEKLALKVALVEQDGAPLPVYFMSWLQANLLFMKLKTIPQAEIDNPPKEPYNFQHLDTFDLLQRARYFVERGNIAAALRYVGALEGASRSAADSWYEAARAHLETKQAAEAVIAHATAIGLQYI